MERGSGGIGNDCVLLVCIYEKGKEPTTLCPEREVHSLSRWWNHTVYSERIYEVESQISENKSSHYSSKYGLSEQDTS